MSAVCLASPERLLNLISDPGQFSCLSGCESRESRFRSCECGFLVFPPDGPQVAFQVAEIGYSGP